MISGCVLCRFLNAKDGTPCGFGDLIIPVPQIGSKFHAEQSWRVVGVNYHLKDGNLVIVTVELNLIA